MKALSKDEYLLAYRRQWPISLVQMGLAVALAAASVQFHDRIVLLSLLAAATLAARLARWAYIRPKIAGRLADAGKPARLLVMADLSFAAGSVIYGLVVYLNWTWRGGWNGLLGAFLVLCIAALPFVGINRALRVALRS
jgi:hypothetical protein